MQKTNKLIWIVVLILIFLIVAFAVFKIIAVKDRYIKTLPDKVEKEQTLNQQDLAKNYETDVREIMDTFLKTETSILEKDYELCRANAKQALDKVMDLRLTSDFKEFHLQLVLVLNSVYEACASLSIKESDVAQKQLTDSMAKINEIFR
ncbi:MAG: hypothetical protein ABIF17_01220 [Patescibacteria group bacterium]